MSFRVSAIVAATVVLGIGSVTPAVAQPQAPIRPRNSQFGNIFSPNRQPGIGAFGQNQPFVNPIGPQVAGVPNAGQFAVPGQGFAGLGYPGQLALQPGLAGGLYGVDPQLPPSGIVGTFNNLGHWYGGNYGHWYPNGIANGRGVLGSSGGGYGGTVGVGPVGGGLQGRTGGTLAGTALTGAALSGALRR